MSNQKASYWRYTGNHPNGNDCAWSNEHGYPTGLIQWVAYNEHDNPDVKIFRGRSDGFGHEVRVTAPQELWESEWVKMAYSDGADITFDKIEQDENGLVWGITTMLYGEPDDFTELFFISEGDTELEMVKNGYAPLNYFIEGDRLWVQCKGVAKS